MNGWRRLFWALAAAVAMLLAVLVCAGWALLVMEVSGLNGWNG